MRDLERAPGIDSTGKKHALAIREGSTENEGLAETLTVLRLGIGPALRTSLSTTNPIESTFSTVRRASRRVTRWQSGTMALRWALAGTMEAEKTWRRRRRHRGARHDVNASTMTMVGQLGLLVGWIVAAAACGRIGFDPLAGGAGDANRDGGGDGGPMLSCSGLADICGPAGTSPCCGSPLVPGGTFYRSFDVGTDNMYTDMTNPATLSDFRLDTYEVTVGRFRQFVNAGMGTQASPPPAGAGARALNGMANQGGWDPTYNASLTPNTAALVAAVKCSATYQSWTDTPGANEALPMNCITWYEAFAFCAWDGGFLPTEAEWNYAAAAGSEQRAYPWSNPPSSLTIDCSYANYYNGTAYCVNPPIGAVNRVGSESPKGDGTYGQADLAGNVWEWTLDWYQNSYGNPCTDCANLTPASYRVFHGGDFFYVGASVLRGALRNGDAPDVRNYGLGVRCGRSP